MYVVFIVISCGLLVSGQTATETVPQLPDNVQTTTQSNVTPGPTTCRSITRWNNLEGLCINRSHCDYGTVVIDFTLYAARGAVRQCPSDKVCCPLHYIIQDTPPRAESNHLNENDFNSDESNLSDY